MPTSFQADNEPSLSSLTFTPASRNASAVWVRKICKAFLEALSTCRRGFQRNVSPTMEIESPYRRLETNGITSPTIATAGG